MTFYHGGLAGTPQPLGNNSSSKFIMEICKARLHFSGGSRGGARGVSTKPRSEGPKKFFGRPLPAPLSNGLDDRPLPTISRSGSGTTISILNFCLMNKGSSFLRSDNFYIWMWSMLKWELPRPSAEKKVPLICLVETFPGTILVPRATRFNL